MADEPAQPTDEDIKPNVEETEEEQQTPDEPTPSEEVDEQETQEEESEEEEEETPPAPSRREQLRGAQLLKKYGPPPEQKPEQRPEAPNYRDMIEAPDDVYDKLEKSNKDFGDRQYQNGQNAALQQMRTVEWRTTLHIDAPSVEREYEVLNPKSEHFHRALADTMNKLYLQATGYDERTGLVQNPNIRYKEFVDGYFELADEIATNKVSQTTTN